MKAGILLGLIASAVWTLQTLSQQEPTYEQTRDWIVSKISDEAGSTQSNPSLGHQTESYKDVSMNGCKLQFTSSLYDSMFGDTSVNVVSVPLDKVKSVSVEHLTLMKTIDEYAVEIKSSPKTVSINGTKKSRDGTLKDQKVTSDDGADIIFGRPKAENEKLANRMQKALTRAAELCRTPVSKEPF